METGISRTSDHFLITEHLSSNLCHAPPHHRTAMSTITVASTGSMPEPYRTYQTRNNSALQATSRTSVKSNGSAQKSNLTPKALTPVLQLSKTAAGRKTSSTPLQEAQETPKASVNITTEKPSSCPLYDDLVDDDDDADDPDADDDDWPQFDRYHHLTTSMSYEK